MKGWSFFLCKTRLGQLTIIILETFTKETRQAYNLFQDLWNRFPYFEGWGVGAKSLGVKAGQTESQTQTDTKHTSIAIFG